MRPAFALLVTLFGSAALAQADSRVAYLTRSLEKATDARLRAQSALLLGVSRNPAAVPPLCNALADESDLVRSAAARSLGQLSDPAGIDCLSRAGARASGELKVTIERARDALIALRDRKHELFIILEPVVDKGGFGSDLVGLAEERLRAKLFAMGSVIAAPNESPAHARAVIAQQHLKAFYVRVQLEGSGAGGIGMTVVGFTYPEKSLLGEVEVKASGARPADLVRALAPKVLDEAAQTFNWGS